MKMKKKNRGVARYSNEISKLTGISNTYDKDEEETSVEKKKTRKEIRKEKRKLKKTKKHAFFSKNKVPDKLPDKKKVEEEKPVKVKKARKIKTKEDGYVSKVEFIRKKQQLENIKYEEKEIKYLEKQLRLNKRKTKKLPKSFIDDGLDYLLDFCDSENREALNEPELSDADSEFQDDVLEALGRKEVSLSSKKRKLSEENSDESEGPAVIKNSKRVKWADQNESDSADHSDNDSDTEPFDDEIFENLDSDEVPDSKKSPQNSNDKAADENYLSDESNENSEVEFSNEDLDEESNDTENENNSDEGSNSESEGDPDEDKLSKKGASKTPGKNGCWEDIYGRMRDAEGNVIKNSEEAGKYIPPAQRLLSANKDEKKKLTLERIKRQLKGLLNRLSESNMKPISSQIEDLYMNHSRHDMNETLTQLLLQSCVSPALTPERLVSEHAMLIAILHANIGNEVGAFVVQTIADRFNELFSQNENHGDGKECDNLLHLLAQIYNFKLIHCTLICDIIKKFGEVFKEKDIDLILMLLKCVGFTLRKDNPAMLKEIITDLQAKAVTVTTSEDQSRVKFMLEILMAIKNNNMQKIPNYDPSRIEHLRKVARNMLRKGSFISELRVSLRDLLDVKERGRWWIVGSAWSGQINNNGEGVKNKKETEGKSSVLEESVSEKILDLAHKQRMNTETRKNIFCVMMTAEDYVDAFNKLLRLGLKNQQEREIIFVSVDCCLHEKKFNPFYAYIIEKFCSYDRRFQMTTQCAVWDKLKESQTLSKIHWSNLAQLISKLILRKGLSISVLKVIQFSDLNKKLVRFLRHILLSILLQESETTCQEVFQRISPSSNLHMFREGLKLFIRHFVLRNKETLTSEELVSKLVHRCELADSTLMAIEGKTRL